MIQRGTGEEIGAWPASTPARPPYVITDEQVRRWNLSLNLAVQVMDEAVDSESVWMAARSIYWSDLPT